MSDKTVEIVTNEIEVESIKKVDMKKELIEWLKSIICAGIAAFLILKFVLFFAFVPTGSMVPTIPEKTRVLVFKCFRYLDWEHRGLTYGDIVVFKFNQTGEETLYVKRVIGMPGDIIKIDNGTVYRNGEELVEPYIAKANSDSYFMNEFEVPEGEIFVLGDNRKGSWDSRYWPHKTVPFEDVVGEVKFK